MTHQHTMFKRIRSKRLRRLEMAFAQELALHINDIRVAIQHTWQQLALFHRRRNRFKRVNILESVARIHKNNVVVARQLNRFVHRIV